MEIAITTQSLTIAKPSGGKKGKVTSTLPPWKRAEKWKLVMKVSGEATFGYSSAYWTNDNLLNENTKCEWVPKVACSGKVLADVNLNQEDCVNKCRSMNDCKCVTWGVKAGAKCRLETGTSLNANAKYSGMLMTKCPFDAKYPAFTKVPFSKIKMCIGSKDKNCVEHKFTRDYANAKALFAAGYLRDKTVDQKGILKAFGPAKDSYQSCPMQRPGFNIQCNDGNKARWGYCTNCASQPCQNSDSNDADASIGIGLAGQSTPRQMGAGWTNYFASGKGTCNANSMTSKQVWFYVYENTML
jgi:hypothetical protein